MIVLTYVIVLIIGIALISAAAYTVGYKAGKAAVPKPIDNSKHRRELIDKYIELSMQAAKVHPEVDPLKALQLTEASENVLKAIYATFPDKESDEK